MINVIWWGGQRGRWDHGLLLSTFDKHPDLFPQYNEPVPPKEINRAIVIVSGCPNEEESKSLFAYLSTMNGKTIVILTSEEDGFFKWQKYIPPQLTIWTAYFTESKRGIKERLLLGAPSRIKDYKINSHLPKKYLWSFIGQIQNTSRQKMLNVLRTLPDGFLHITELFGGEGEKGMEYQNYLDVCCQSKFVVCGAGSMNVDSFRVYESILCGAIPITEKRCQRDPEGFNYWNEVYPNHRLLLVDNWGELLTTYNPFYLESATSPLVQNKWWEEYKEQLEQKLLHAAGNS